MTTEGAKNAQMWKSSSRRLGRQQKNGSGGCGVAIKAVGKKKWITISSMAVLLKACTAMAAEITGVSVLCEVLQVVAVDWIFFDIYLGVFWAHVIISRKFFNIAELVIDFRKSQKSYVS